MKLYLGSDRFGLSSIYAARSHSGPYQALIFIGLCWSKKLVTGKRVVQLSRRSNAIMPSHKALRSTCAPLPDQLS